MADATERQKTPEGLWTTADVVAYTGWGRTHISKLCSAGLLPHIPGRSNKFVPAAVKEALEKMQVGGKYGRRKLKKQVAKSA